jgi:hypothetical protein
LNFDNTPAIVQDSHGRILKSRRSTYEKEDTCENRETHCENIRFILVVLFYTCDGITWSNDK